MSFTDEEFDRLESEIAALFFPAEALAVKGSRDQRVDRILDRVQDVDASVVAESDPSDEGASPSLDGQ